LQRNKINRGIKKEIKKVNFEISKNKLKVKVNIRIERKKEAIIENKIHTMILTI